MIEPASHDYTLFYGEDWLETITLYADATVTRWRGEYNEDYLYLAGDGVMFSGAAYVALREDTRTDPGPDNAAFWSSCAPLDLTGCTDVLVCGVFTATLNPEPLLGRLNVNVPHARFATAPGSSHYYLEHTDSSGAVSYPLRGTLIFRQP